MSYLSIALFAEGATDHRFLSPVARRTAEELCLAHGRQIIEVGPLLALHAPGHERATSRDLQILGAVRAADAAFHVLLIHTDGAGDAERALTERVAPARARMAAELQGGEARAVGVVPVRETEAWALADGHALREAFGTGLSDEQLGIPWHAQDVELVPDPKRALQQVLDRVIGHGRRRRRRAADFLEAIGERVRLDVLARVPAFRRFRDELHSALRRQGFLRP